MSEHAGADPKIVARHWKTQPAGKTPIKCFRISADLYTAAQVRAAERGETLTDVVRRALERYVKAKGR